MEKAKLLWFVFLSSIGVYGALPFLISPAVDEPQAVLLFALGGTAALAALLSFLVPAAMERSAPAERAEGFDLTLCILRWTFSETIAIFGLVLFILGHGAIYAWGFALAAGALMVVHAPGVRESTARTAQEMAHPDVKIG